MIKNKKYLEASYTYDSAEKTKHGIQERKRKKSRVFTSKSKDLRHGDSSKKPERQNLPKNAPKRAEKREPRKIITRKKLYISEKQEFMSEI